MTVRRTVFATIAGLVTWMLLVVVFGVAAAGDDLPPDVPESFGTVAPKVGDRVAYAAARVDADPGTGGGLAGPEAPWMELGWEQPEDMVDGAGRAVRANRLVVVELPADDGPTLRTAYMLRASDATVVALQEETNTRYERTFPSKVVVDQQRAIVTWENRTVQFPPLGASIPCVAVTAFQERTLPLAGVVELFPRCFLSWNHNGEQTTFEISKRSFKAIAAQKTPEALRVIFSNGDGVYVWLRQDSAYPDLVVFRTPDGQFHSLRRSAFEPGDGGMASSDAPRSASDAPSLTWADPGPWGPNDEDFDPSFGLTVAFEYARNDPSAPALREFLTAHDSAFIESAVYSWDYTGGSGTTREAWMFVVSDGHDRLPVGLVRTDRSESSLTLGLMRKHATTYTYENGSLPSSPPAPRMAGSMPTIASLTTFVESYHGPRGDAQGTTGWGFRLSCADERCGETRFDMWAGPEGDYHDSDGSVSFSNVERRVVVTESGWVEGYEESYQTYNGSVTFAPLVATSLPSSPVGISAVSVSPWHLPAAGVAAAAGLAAVLVGLVYWAWPLLRQGVGMAFFSRIEAPVALDHPGRSMLFELVRNTPGIHVQEIIRRTGQGPSPTLHHLRHLVRLGILSETRTAGYTCYFVKGAVDRQAMAATPALKADGARRILRVVAEHPGATSGQVSVLAGLDPGTVSYHIKRLTGAALVRPERKGRELFLTVTDLGRAMSNPADT